jgi:predicted urease superfamily metal-dependent hydrolase
LERLVDIGVLDANETVGEDDMRLRRYLRMKTFSLLPRKFPVEHGDGVFDVIRDYLEKPQTAYGVLDAVIHPGEVEQLTEAEILAMQTDKAQAEAQAAQAQLAIQTNAGRVRFAEMLKPHYPTPADIKRAMNELGLPSYTLENHDELFTALLAHAQQRE